MKSAKTEETRDEVAQLKSDKALKRAALAGLLALKVRRKVRSIFEILRKDLSELREQFSRLEKLNGIPGPAPTLEQIEEAARKHLTENRDRYLGEPGQDASLEQIMAAASAVIKGNPELFRGMRGRAPKREEIAEVCAIWLGENWERLKGKDGVGKDGKTPTTKQLQDLIVPIATALITALIEANPRRFRGKSGVDGEMPRHQWNGTFLRFEEEPGVWGKYVNLQGPAGGIEPRGGGGSSATTTTPPAAGSGGGVGIRYHIEEDEKIHVPYGHVLGFIGSLVTDGVRANDGIVYDLKQVT